jgi:hypothetical protein
MKSLIKWLFSFSLLQIIVLCLFASFRFVSLESTITLCVFNFFFASIIFLLNGTVNRKLGTLAMGNVVGLFWNMIFHYFSLVGTFYFGGAFQAFYTVTFPLLNLMWVVPFWSVSISFLPKPQNAGLRGETL